MAQTITPEIAAVAAYNYSEDGRMMSNENGIGSRHGFSPEAMGADQVVTVTDASGNATRHAVTREATEMQMRSATITDGTTTTLIAQVDGTTVKIGAHGTRMTTVLGLDPRWRMNAPLVRSMTQTTAEGLVLMTLATTLLAHGHQAVDVPVRSRHSGNKRICPSSAGSACASGSG